MSGPSAEVKPSSAPLAGWVDERSLEDFYRREIAGLIALARALGPSHLAEDIAQDAMLVALRRWPEIRGLDYTEAWVRRTCANLAVSQFRRGLAELRALNRTRTVEYAAGPADPEEFWRLVRLLPRRQAQCVALHYLYDLSVVEIALTLGCSEGSVRVHLSRARDRLWPAAGHGSEGEVMSLDELARSAGVATGAVAKVRLPDGWFAESLDVSPSYTVVTSGSVDGEVAIMTLEL